METIVQALGSLYALVQQNPITAFVGLATVIAALALVMAAKPEGMEKPLLKRRRVWLPQAVLNIWTVRLPHRRIAHALKWKQRWLVMCKEHASEMCLVIGSTGVGKSKRLIIQMIVTLLLHRKKSVVANDPSGEIYRFCEPFLGYASGSPATHVLSSDPDHPDEDCSAVDVFANRESVERFIQGGLDTLDAADKSWGEAGKNLWVSVWQAEGRPDFPTTYKSMNNVKRLDQLAEQYPEMVGSHWRGSDMKGGHQDARRQAIIPFQAVEKPHVARLFSRGRAGDFPGPQFEERVAVFLTSKDGDSSADGIFAGLTAELMYRARYRPKGSPRAEFYVDEAGTRYPIANVGQDINTVRKAGINMLLAIQSVAQLRGKMNNPHDADDALGAARLTIIGASNDKQTADYAEWLAGTTEVKRHSHSWIERVMKQLRGKEVPKPERRRENRLRSEHIPELKDGEIVVFPKPRKPRIVRQKAAWPQRLYASLVVLVGPHTLHQS